MDARRAIRSRRSVRRYAKRPPDKRAIRSVIEAGIWAPSGLNNQPWKFRVVRAPGELSGMSRFTDYGHIVRAAPAAICLFLDKKASYNREKDILAVGACAQNMLLEAHALGLGACWLGEILNRKDDVRRFLKVPSSCELMAVITLGYPLKRCGRGSRRKPKGFILV